MLISHFYRTMFHKSVADQPDKTVSHEIFICLLVSQVSEAFFVLNFLMMISVKSSVSCHKSKLKYLSYTVKRFEKTFLFD